MTSFSIEQLDPDVDVLASPLSGTDSAQASDIPDVVRNFVAYLHQKLCESDVAEVANLTEHTLAKLSERFFKSAPWPTAEAVAPLLPEKSSVPKDLFLCLYNELRYRHIYSRLQQSMTFEERLGSFNNYAKLFGLLLDSKTPVPLVLPNQWLWDIVDEFIYQFQSFAQYRSKLKNKSDAELAALKANGDVWSVRSVLSFLQRFVEKSAVLASLEADAGAAGKEDIFATIGYFSLVGLARVHTLLGDYQLAMQTLAPIDLSKKHGLFTRVPSCQLTLYYYLGFSNLMLRRYSHAIRAFSTILQYMGRTRQYFQKQSSSQYEQAWGKKNEQMYALLAICIALSPQRVDEQVHTMLREKYGDRIQRMQRGDEESYEELFVSACPKFILACPPSLEGKDAAEASNNHNQAAYRLQKKIFLAEVRQQVLLPTIRSYLKLYTTISVAKLAQFLDVSEAQCRTYLMCLKHKTNKDKPKTGGRNDVQFTIDNDVVHVLDTQANRKRQHYDWFLKSIDKLDRVMGDMGRREATRKANAQ